MAEVLLQKKLDFSTRNRSGAGPRRHVQGDTFSSFLPFLCLLFSCQEFSLIDRRELAPLHELIEKLGSKDR